MMTLLANRFQLLTSLGEGAMGKVWLASDTTNDRQVALKVISKAFGATEKSILLFKQEFRLMAGLRHPHCCEVYDFGVTPDGEPFFSMEVVPGQGLDEMLPLPAPRVRELLAQLLLALGYIHLQGYVHRDLKAANVRVQPDGTLKLMDYGLMDHVGTGGVIAGTLPYISPEMARRDPVDGRSDLYAVGILGYELLAGKPPFQGASPVELLKAHLREPPPPLQVAIGEPDPALEAILLKLLSKEPIARYQSAQETLEALGFAAPERAGARLLYAPLIGRDALLEPLQAAVARLHDERVGETFVLEGPAGIGKSRVLQELRHLSQLAGLACAEGANFASSQVPYGPFIQVLRQLLPVLRSHAPMFLAKERATLALLLPELAERDDEEATTDAWQQLQRAVAEALATVARATGLVVLLEDWQWADSSSEQLLQAMQRVSAQDALLFVVSRRPDAGRAVPGRRLAVAPLSADDVERVLGAMLGEPALDPGFARQVAELADGNPAFVERVLEHLVKRGLLTSANGRWQAPSTLPLDDLPRNHTALVREALAMLSDDALFVARVGALAGREFELDVVAYVADMDTETLFAALDELRRARLLSVVKPGTYAFAEEEFQELLYEGLDPLDRDFLHGVLGRAYEERVQALGQATAPLELVLATAEHYLRSPSRERAVSFALEAGIRCAGLQAGSNARRMLLAALALMDEQPEAVAPVRRLEALSSLGKVYRAAGNLDGAIATYEEGLWLAGALGRQRARAGLLLDLAKAEEMSGQKAAALQHLGEALAAAQHFPALLVAGMVARARHLYFGGRAAEALADARAALEQAIRHDVPRWCLADAQAFLGFLLVTGEAARREEGMGLLRSAIATYEAAGQTWRVVDPYAYLGTALQQQGDSARAREAFQLMRHTAFSCGLATQEVIAGINLSICDLTTGAYAEGARRAHEAFQLAEATDYAFPAPMARILEAACLARHGQHERVDAVLADALARSRAVSSPYVSTQVMIHLCELLFHQGRWEMLAGFMATFRQLTEETHLPDARVALTLLDAELAGRRGQLGEACTLLASLRDGLRDTPGSWARLRYLEGLLSLWGEAWEEAASALQEALGLARSLGARPLEAWLHGSLGELALAKGEPARDCFVAMAELAEALEVPLIAAQAAFGLAAADPYQPDAKALAERAQHQLAACAERLPAGDRETFHLFVERRRVREGNFMAFSLPKRQRSPMPPSPRLGFGPL